MTFWTVQGMKGKEFSKMLFGNWIKFTLPVLAEWVPGAKSFFLSVTGPFPAVQEPFPTVSAWLSVGLEGVSLSFGAIYQLIEHLWSSFCFFQSHTWFYCVECLCIYLTTPAQNSISQQEISWSSPHATGLWAKSYFDYSCSCTMHGCRRGQKQQMQGEINEACRQIQCIHISKWHSLSMSPGLPQLRMPEVRDFS